MIFKREKFRNRRVQHLPTPNSDFIKNHIANWTLGNHSVRISVQVGVAYGSDVSVVMNTLIGSAEVHEQVLNKPVPEVIFSDFGESTLDFELRVWTRNANSRLRIASELRLEINKRFQDANIEIAFPQRDIHPWSGDGAEPFKPNLESMTEKNTP